MPIVKNIEKRIWEVEQFDVTIKHADGRDMRGDRTGLPTYPFERMAKNATTAAAWRDQRFRPTYAGLEVDVLDGTGQPVAWNTRPLA